jgi:hypothetical protein
MHMRRTRFTLRAFAALAASLAWTACTVHKQETPPLTGPSEQSTAIVVTVSPDVLVQDGSSQSLVQITARDANGQPMRSASLRVEVAVGGAIADFGTLSARNVVTDANGRASVVYTAPPAPAFALVTDTIIQIIVTPAGTDFGNATSADGADPADASRKRGAGPRARCVLISSCRAARRWATRPSSPRRSSTPAAPTPPGRSVSISGSSATAGRRRAGP